MSQTLVTKSRIAVPPVLPERMAPSAELAAELNRMETEAQIERDRLAAEKLARLRDLARFD